MKVAIIGSGNVGQALARGFASRKHELMISSRSPEKLQEFAAEAKVKTGNFAEAAAFGEIVVLCTKGTEHKSVVGAIGLDNLDDKVIIDVTNPLEYREASGGEQLQGLAPKARVVKCFNIVNNADMVDPDYPDGPPTMMIAGNDEEAKQTVTQICHDFGWEDVIDVGDIVASRDLEALTMLWVKIGLATGKWTNAFRVLRR